MRLVTVLACPLSFLAMIAVTFPICVMSSAGEIPQFWQNYRDEIISLQIDRKVDGYAADQQ